MANTALTSALDALAWTAKELHNAYLPLWQRTREDDRFLITALDHAQEEILHFHHLYEMVIEGLRTVSAGYESLYHDLKNSGDERDRIRMNKAIKVREYIVSQLRYMGRTSKDFNAAMDNLTTLNQYLGNLSTREGLVGMDYIWEAPASEIISRKRIKPLDKVVERLENVESSSLRTIRMQAEIDGMSDGLDAAKSIPAEPEFPIYHEIVVTEDYRYAMRLIQEAARKIDREVIEANWLTEENYEFMVLRLGRPEEWDAKGFAKQLTQAIGARVDWVSDILAWDEEANETEYVFEIDIDDPVSTKSVRTKSDLPPGKLDDIKNGINSLGNLMEVIEHHWGSLQEWRNDYLEPLTPQQKGALEKAYRIIADIEDQVVSSRISLPTVSSWLASLLSALETIINKENKGRLTDWDRYYTAIVRALIERRNILNEEIYAKGEKYARDYLFNQNVLEMIDNARSYMAGGGDQDDVDGELNEIYQMVDEVANNDAPILYHRVHNANVDAEKYLTRLEKYINGEYIR